eukprot:451528-Amphidinium_carterae.1
MAPLLVILGSCVRLSILFFAPSSDDDDTLCVLETPKRLFNKCALCTKFLQSPNNHRVEGFMKLFGTARRQLGQTYEESAAHLATGDTVFMSPFFSQCRCSRAPQITCLVVWRSGLPSNDWGGFVVWLAHVQLYCRAS